MKLVVYIITLFTPTFLLAQKNFQPGHLVTLRGDTLQGEIDYREWEFSPIIVLFRSGTQSKEYDVTNTQYFEVRNKVAYQRFITRVSMGAEKLNDVYGRDTTSRIDTVFMKVLYRGKSFSLFAYTDIIKERYYVMEHGKEQPAELIRREYYIDEDRTKITSENFFRQQLSAFLLSGGNYNVKLANQINSAQYNENDLKKILYTAESLSKEEQIIQSRHEKNVRFFVGGGIQKSSITFSGEQFFATRPSSESSSFLPAILAGLNFTPNPNTGKLVFRLQAGYHNVKSTTTGSSANNTTSVYELNISSFSLHSFIIFNIYNKPNFKIPIGVAGGYAINSYTKNKLTDSYTNQAFQPVVKNDYFKLQKGYVSPIFYAGVVLFQKIEVSGLYQIPVELTSYTKFGVSKNIMQLQALYSF